MGMEEKYLWRQIIRRPTQRPRRRFAGFGETKISNPDVSIGVEKNIFWFKISIYNVFIMQMVQRECNLCCIEFRDRIWKTLNTDKIKFN